MYGYFSTPLGVGLGYIWSEGKLMEMNFYRRKTDFLRVIREDYLGARENRLKDLGMLLSRYFRGERVDLDYPIELRGTEFQIRVWKIVKKIPYGETRSYKWVAERAGNPRAARAVGNAMASNPIVLIVPCHRVIKSDGSLGKYGSMPWLKKKLLKLERAVL